MNREAYAAARTVAPRVQAYFARRHDELSGRGVDDLAPLPDAATIEALIDASFWTSLRREEGFVPKISLAFLSPPDSAHALIFERRLSLDSNVLTRVAPAVERPGIHLAVWRDQDELSVWGVIRTVPALCFVVEVAAPGLLVIKHHSGEESGKFINVAVLEGDQIKMVDERGPSLPGRHALLRPLLGFDSLNAWVHSFNIIVELAVSMRAHGHGGALLIVPAGTASWRESILQPMQYSVSPPFLELARLSQDVADGQTRGVWQKALRRAIDAVAGLTAVDGAVVLTDQYDLLGFGAKISRRKGAERIEQVLVTEPIVGGVAALVHPEQLGGTRHLSAAQFVQDQRDAVALVASQDGRFTLFEWSHLEAMVHAHRVEALLL